MKWEANNKKYKVLGKRQEKKKLPADFCVRGAHPGDDITKKLNSVGDIKGTSRPSTLFFHSKFFSVNWVTLKPATRNLFRFPFTHVFHSVLHSDTFVFAFVRLAFFLALCHQTDHRSRSLRQESHQIRLLNVWKLAICSGLHHTCTLKVCHCKSSKCING